jgi:hypothetical protein
MINQSHIVLVLVSNNTHERQWVNYEVNHGLCHDMEVIWTQLPGTFGAPPAQLRGQAPVPFKMGYLRTPEATPLVGKGNFCCPAVVSR